MEFFLIHCLIFNILNISIVVIAFLLIAVIKQSTMDAEEAIKLIDLLEVERSIADIEKKKPQMVTA